MTAMSPVPLLLLSVGAAAGIFIGVAIWLRSKRSRAPAVRMEGGTLFVESGSIAIGSIERIGIAPMYDVAPADDLWTIRDRDGRQLSFFGRDPGAREVLVALEASLAGLDLEQAREVARRESLFEEEVTVWKRSDS